MWLSAFCTALAEIRQAAQAINPAFMVVGNLAHLTQVQATAKELDAGLIESIHFHLAEDGPFFDRMGIPLLVYPAGKPSDLYERARFVSNVERHCPLRGTVVWNYPCRVPLGDRMESLVQKKETP